MGHFLECGCIVIDMSLTRALSFSLTLQLALLLTLPVTAKHLIANWDDKVEWRLPVKGGAP